VLIFNGGVRLIPFISSSIFWGTLLFYFIIYLILWSTLLLIALAIYKLNLNVPNKNKVLCFLRISVNEVIHNLLYNKNNNYLSLYQYMFLKLLIP
jgi:hypothetical protein